MKFDRLGVFTYSKEEDTPAASMNDQISEEVKEERQDQIMLLQQDIAFDQGESMVGRKLKVIVEGKLPDDEALDYSEGEAKSIYICRTYKDAPGVDGYIFVPSSGELISGDFIDVEVTGAKDYDLIGSIIVKEGNR